MNRIVTRLACVFLVLVSNCALAGNNSVILFLGDGMGISTVTAARIFAGQQKGLQGEEYSLAFDDFEHTALIKTYNVDSQVPDSAGTISAILTGEKTRMGVLSIAAKVERGDCSGALKNSLPTILELAEQRGLATGIVSTARITHATPGGTYAHVPDRDWEDNASLSEDAVDEGCRDIATQLVEFSHGDGIDVIMGGGRANFMPVELSDPEYPTKMGRRTDKRDLLAEWQKGGSDRTYLWRTKELNAYVVAPGKQLLGLFQPSHMQFEADRKNDTGGEPSLAQMTGLAIQQLQQNENGFFLLIEGGRIDHAHHFGNAYRALVDTVAMSDAVVMAQKLTKSEDTLIVVTADHSHTLTISGYPPRGNPILGKVPENPLFAGMEVPPYTTLGYANGPGYQKSFPDLSDVDTQAPDYRQIAGVPLLIETHAGEDVAAFATGVGADQVHGVMEQNKLFDVMQAVLITPKDNE